MRRVRPTRARTASALALALALLALAVSLRGSPLAATPVLVAAVAALSASWLEWDAPPPLLRRLLPRLHGIVLLTVALVAWFSRSLGLWQVPPATLALAGALVVVPASLCFLLAPAAFAPARTLVPATIGALALAGLDPRPEGFGASRLTFLRGSEHSAYAEVYLALSLAVVVALWTSALLSSGPRWRAREVAAQAGAVVLALGLAAAGVVGLPLLQPRVERMVAEALTQGRTGLAGESVLGEFAFLAVSRRRVLDLQAWSLRPTTPASGHWLLRAEVLTAFDGRRWTARPDRARALQPVRDPVDGGPLQEDGGAWFRPPDTPSDGAAALRVHQQELDRWPLLLPRGAALVNAEASFLELDRFGFIRRPPGIGLRLYGALLDGAGPPGRVDALSEAERAESLALADVDPRVRELAARLAPASASAAEKLRATIAHLQSAYAYTLRPGAFVTGDPLAEFLFDKREGYCEYFATAGVVLLRLQGVPARFVKGLGVGPQNEQGGGLHVVRESDAHAWLEAWLPGEGWVEADPTPPGAAAAAAARPGRIERALQRARAAASLAWSRLVSRGPLVFLRALARDVAALALRLAREPLAWLAALALVLGPRLVRGARALRRRRAASRVELDAVPAGLRALVREAERRWRANGRPRPASRGLLEHALAVRAESPAPEHEACLQVVGVYYDARFGGVVPETAELEQLRRMLGR